MWHISIDLHRQSIVLAAVNDAGEVRPVKPQKTNKQAGNRQRTTKQQPQISGAPQETKSPRKFMSGEA
jgi:hypothetical protein